MAITPTRAINLAQQLTAIKSALPAASGTIKRGQLDCSLPMQPCPASPTYVARLLYRHRCKPRVTVTEPDLTLHTDARVLPHVYSGDELCLCYPNEWRDDMLLATTIVPWAAEWLMHYELWLITRRWAGGGHDAPSRAA